MRGKVGYIVLAAGGAAAGFVLRGLQVRHGFEAESGLQIPGSPYHRLLLGLLIVLGLVLAILVRRVPESEQAEGSTLTGYFRADGMLPLVMLAGGLFLMAASGVLEVLAGVSGTLTEDGPMISPVQVIKGLMAVCAGISLLPLCTACRHPESGRTPTGVLLIPTVALVARLILAYRGVSVNPTLAAWYVEILTLAALILSLFWMSAFAYGNGKPRRYIWMTSMAVVLCGAALADGTELTTRLFYGGGLLVDAGLLLLYV